MTPLILYALVDAGGSPATSVILKATVTSAIALLIARLTRKRRASLHHVVFVAAFVTLVIIPIAAIVLPTVAVPLAVSGDEGELFARMSSIGSGSIIEPQTTVREINAPINIDLPISRNALLFVVWSATVLIFLLPMAVGLCQLYQAQRSAITWLNGERVVQQLASGAGIRRPVAVLLHESACGPLTFGLLRPVILFPTDAPTWNADDVRRAMIHELEHIRRGDWLVHCIARTICAFYWFHPLVWISWRQLRMAAERACDDAVLSAGEPIAYASQLVSLAERLSVESKRPLLAMASRGDLAGRVTAVLSPHQQRGRTGRVCLAATLASALLFAVAISPVRAVSVTTTQTTARANQSPASFDVTSIKPFSGRGPYGLQIFPGGRVAGRNNLFGIISQAYGVPVRQIEGDSPILNEFFDVEATAPANVFPDVLPTRQQDFEPVRRQLQGMLQMLLAERFKLAIHTVTKEFPVYALVIGKNGPRLKPMPPDWDCQKDAKCSFIAGPARGLSGHLEISELAGFLSHFVDRQVIDRTGLKGTYEVELPPWNPTNPIGTRVRLDDNDEPQPNPNDASIFTVLQERLGLKLESSRAPLEVYVIDHVERPDPN
ncbi:MAG TPA: M56 family metallopeptidase [Terriglobia bacterium]|nr:M56 family metallopeptidase [Terriglobia bacterium]